MSWISEARRKVRKETSRFLDRRIGIDDAGIRDAFTGEFMYPNNEMESLEPLQPFALPTHFELSSARGELQSSLRKKRARGKTDFTGGLLGGGGNAPRLQSA